MTRYVSSLLLLLWFCGNCDAGKYNQVLDIGDDAPAWSDLPGTDGEKHSLDQLADARAIVIVFTCNSCPYAVDVEDRLIEFHEQFSQQGVALVAINVNKVPQDRMPAMKEKAEAKGFEFPYLFDESQQIAKQYGAKNTPQFFVLDQRRKVAYMGSFDDSPDGKQVQQTYVKDAVKAILEGDEPEISETVPIGCLIRYERERRSRRSER